jgi:DNA-binding transcriptional LysR family regulator
MPRADLPDLDAFAAVARARSFRGAAAARGVSASALSEAVRRLEAALGVRLLNRTTRSVTPTEAGGRLLERLGPALGEVLAALDAVNSFRDTPAGTLRLNVPTMVARMILQDRLFRKLQMLDDAATDQDLRVPPGNHFEKLSGKLKAYHSIRVNQKWRLVFRWDRERGEASHVYLDDHSYR